RQDNLPVADFAFEEYPANQRIGCSILEDARSADGCALHPAARQQLPPAPGGVGIRYIHGFGVEGDALGAQARAGFKRAVVTRRLEQDVLASLCCHSNLPEI